MFLASVLGLPFMARAPWEINDVLPLRRERRSRIVSRQRSVVAPLDGCSGGQAAAAPPIYFIVGWQRVVN